MADRGWKDWDRATRVRLAITFAVTLAVVVALLVRARATAPKGPRVIKRAFPVRDGPLVAYPDYVIKDTRTGLEWYYRHDSRFAGWSEGVARDWVSNLSVGGGGWRLPSLVELYDLVGAGSSNQGRKFDLDSDWTGNRSPLFWELESEHSFRGAWIWSGDTVVEIRGAFLGAGTSAKMRRAKDGERLLYFDFQRARARSTGPSPALEDIDLYLAALAARRVHAGVFAVRKARRQ